VEPIESFGSFGAAELADLVGRPAAFRPRRDPETLDWLYFGTPHLRRTRMVLAAKRGGRLLGYLSLRRLPASAELLECRTAPDCEEAPAALLDAARSWARRARLSHILVYPYSDAVARALPRTATFQAGRRLSFSFLIHLKRSGLATEDFEFGPWDGDAVTTDDAPALDGTLEPGGGAAWG
jgi:hypothetical protein